MELRRAEDEAALQARLAAIIEHSDDAIYSKDRDAIIMTWNPAAERLYGFSADEAIGSPISIIVPDGRRGEELILLNAILQGNHVDHYETQRRAKDGTIIDVSITASPIRDRESHIVGASVIARDVTDKRRLQQLRRTLERQDFIAKAAHELRNPLSAIAGFTDLLRHRRNELTEEELDRFLDALIRQGARARVLIDDLLDLANIESSQFSVDLRRVRLADSVTEAVGLAGAEAEGTVEVHVDGDIEVLADPIRLEQVLVNLIANAFKYGGDTVKVESIPYPDGVVVAVIDDGPGVAPSFVSKMFEPFTRADSSGSAGSGLGLSIAQRLVEAFGGRLWYEADPSGGARFSIRLSNADP